MAAAEAAKFSTQGPAQAPRDLKEEGDEEEQRTARRHPVLVPFAERLGSAMRADVEEPEGEEDRKGVGEDKEEEEGKRTPVKGGKARKKTARSAKKAKGRGKEKRKQRQSKSAAAGGISPWSQTPMFEGRLQEAEEALEEGKKDEEPREEEEEEGAREGSEERRSREYLEVLEILEAGLSKAPYKYRKSLHATRQPRTEEEEPAGEVWPLRPSPHGGTPQPPPHPGPQVRRVLSPVVRRGTAPPPSPPVGLPSASPTGLRLRSGELRVLGRPLLPGGTSERLKRSPGRTPPQQQRQGTPAFDTPAPRPGTLPEAFDHDEEREEADWLGSFAAALDTARSKEREGAETPEGPSPARVAWDETFSEETAAAAASPFSAGGFEEDARKHQEATSAPRAAAAEGGRLDFLCGEILELERQLFAAQRRLLSPPGISGREEGDEEAKNWRRDLKRQYRQRQQELEALKGVRP